MPGLSPAPDLGLIRAPTLYTLTLSCPDERWPTLGPIYEACQKSFRLTPTTKVMHNLFLRA